MAKTTGVRDGGGTIGMSESGVDEAGCFRKPARWCDYSGSITAADRGILTLDERLPSCYEKNDSGSFEVLYYSLFQFFGNGKEFTLRDKPSGFAFQLATLLPSRLGFYLPLVLSL